MNKEVENVINRLKEIRKQKKISIVQLSVDSGISRSHLFYIESMRTSPSLETLSKIAESLDISLKDLFV